MREAFAQDVEVGPVRVDTGNAALDLAGALVLLAAFAIAVIVVSRWGKP